MSHETRPNGQTNKVLGASGQTTSWYYHADDLFIGGRGEKGQLPILYGLFAGKGVRLLIGI